MTNFTSKFNLIFNLCTDFFFCGYLKLKVYFNRSNNLEDLRQRIRSETEQISPDIIERGVQCSHSCMSAK
jgi:hypothetical protein